MYQIKTSLTPLHITLFAALALLSSAAPAASQCKGMPENACAAAGGCTWVQGYVRKDGRSVSSHCKTRSGKKAGGQAMPDDETLGKGR